MCTKRRKYLCSTVYKKRGIEGPDVQHEHLDQQKVSINQNIVTKVNSFKLVYFVIYTDILKKPVILFMLIIVYSQGVCLCSHRDTRSARGRKHRLHASFYVCKKQDQSGSVVLEYSCCFTLCGYQNL